MPHTRPFAQLAGVTLALAIVCTATTATGQTDQMVRIGVLSLFHPTEFKIQAGNACVLHLAVEGITRTLSERDRVSILAASGDQVLIRFADGSSQHGHQLSAACAARDTGRIWLEIPGKLRRPYAGSVEIHTVQAHARNGAPARVLEAVITMPIETAVASVVEAESPSLAGIEALKAQAVAARSFLVAHRTAHRDFDACDTTHCQFLRSPPAINSPAERAAQATAGLVLTFRDEASARDETLAAMYARSCGGRTRSLREIGVRASGYPYYAVHCSYCSRHPETWRNPAGSAQVRNERDRLAWNRIHGWGSIPSLADNRDEASGLTTGRGVGHGVGLCQLGAADMARHGAGFAQILAHYYPNTRLTSLTNP